MKTENVFGMDKACLAGEPDTAFEIDLKHFKKEYDEAAREMFAQSKLLRDGMRCFKERLALSVYGGAERSILRKALEKNYNIMAVVFDDMKEIKKLMKELMN